MPILDPAFQLCLLNIIENNSFKLKETKNVFIFYLEKAQYYNKYNIDTIKNSIQFKKDLKNNINFINQRFHYQISIEKDINNPSINNFYKFLCERIDPNLKKEYQSNDSIIGFSFCYKKTDFTLFMPEIEFNFFHRWFFTGTPTAILSVLISSNINKDNDINELINYLNIEIDLMIACKYVVVLCIFWDPALIKFERITNLFYLMKNHNFAEIHINIGNISKKNAEDLESFFDNFYDCLNEINNFVYFYSPFVQDYSSKASKILKKMKQNSFFQNISFSIPIKEAIFTENLLKQVKSYTSFGGDFVTDFIQVFLSNVPIYNSDDDINDLTPSISSGTCLCYVLPQDFLYYNGSRVKIILYDEDNNQFCYKYVNFEDIHLIKPDLYVNEKLSLIRTDYSTLTHVNEIISHTNEQLEKKSEFSKKSSLSFLFNQKITKILGYVSYAYTDYMRTAKKIEKFNLHKNQIFTALEACKSCLFESKKIGANNRGVVYQVETGEGKSCIVCLIASLLALMKKTVHIASSNIPLANRDYYESFEFFKKIGLKSAVLLHRNELPIKNPAYDLIRYPKEFYRKKLFENSSNMNFSVCGITNNNEISKDKADIVFSTFVNFESLYLRMMEMCPGYIRDYFKKCVLVIDEADSILIDELTNGTILSRSLKTNGDKILKLVYERYIENKSEEEVFSEVKNQFPKCFDIEINDIKEMFQQINLVQQEEFVNGKKYSIESYNVKEKESIIQNAKDFINDTENKMNKGIKQIFTKKSKSVNQDAKIVKRSYRKKITTYKKIVPFDYDHKGVLEPNKEFSGFVQQFIAIKEIYNNSKENENMTIKDVSMNYLYVSHPIFVGLYNGVCGLTGTIGNKYDKHLLYKQYNLLTKKIPREKSNLRVEYPILLCDDIKDRNNKIVSEVLNVRNKNIPVLVIFQDLNEISDVFSLLIMKGINSIYVFDGKNDKIKPDKFAGYKGAVSLGTNVCGRGTDIKNPAKPLHVIVTYFSSNSRVMHQAFGRTARQGNEGSVRIICLKNQFISPISIINDIEMKRILGNFKSKNEFQRSFIEKFREKRKWIFTGDIKSQQFSDEEIGIMRKCKINVNRIKVFNYEFPICLKISTFLLIQAQKIFSLYNCPNCRYTWMLFQKYIREMILESWSLFIEKAEKQFLDSKIKMNYSDFLGNQCKALYGLLSMYLPDSDDPNDYEIVPTFLHIFKLVRDKYEDEIMRVFPKEMNNCFKQYGKKKYCSFTFGFKPFTLVDKSGVKINKINGDDQKQTFIEDPELKYERKYPNHCFSTLSITEKIDGIFNMICQKINQIIGSYIGLNFFLRRTLGGCEFGVCFDFDIENLDENILRDQICIVDKDPLLMFTISVKSIVPLLAGILIIGLVYIASVAKNLFEWISNFIGKGIVEIAKFTIKEVAKRFAVGGIEMICDNICSFLNKIIVAQISKMKEKNLKIADIFVAILKITSSKNFSKSGDIINSMFESKMKVNLKFDYVESIIDDINPIQHFLKIGLLLMLCFASFMINFHFNNQAVTYDGLKVSGEFDEEQNTEKVFEQNKDVVSENDLPNLTKEDNS